MPSVNFRSWVLRMIARWQVRVLIVALALALGLPALLIGFQDERELRTARNKTLANWPDVRDLGRRPEQYFAAARAWTADRVGLGMTAAGLVRWVKMFGFRDDPTANLTLSGEHLFLNAWDPNPARRFTIFSGSCRRPAGTIVSDLVQRSRIIQAYFENYGATVRYVFIPSTPVIYADHLPRTVPNSLRQNCVAAMQGKSYLGPLVRKIGIQSVLYPLEEFLAHRGSKSFYPTQSFHCVGEAVWLVARRYFEEFEVPFDSELLIKREIDGRSELSLTLGFALPVRYVTSSVAGLTTQTFPDNIPSFEDNFRRMYRHPRQVAYLKNPGALSSKTALLLSDSFGNAIRTRLSLGYKALFHVNISGMSHVERRSDAFFAYLMKTLRPDHVIILSYDGGAAGLITRISESVRHRLSKKLTHKG